MEIEPEKMENENIEIMKNENKTTTTLVNEDTSVCSLASFSESSSVSSSSTSHQTYRYKYTKEMVDVMSQFARDNMESDKNEFVAAWKNLLRDDKVDEMVKRETQLLESTGYTGCVPTKMYKSVRYYFMKKARLEEATERMLNNTIKEMEKESNEDTHQHEDQNDVDSENSENSENNENNENSKNSDTPQINNVSTNEVKTRKTTESKETLENRKKRAYYKINKDILRQMDEFIHGEKNTIINKYAELDEDEDVMSDKKRLKPSIMYEKFCEKYDDVLENEQQRMIEETYPKETILTKIKKTFKNRCYTILSNKKDV